MLNEKMSDLRFKLSEKSLQLLPEYHQKLDVRRKRDRERGKGGKERESICISSNSFFSGPQTFWFH